MRSRGNSGTGESHISPWKKWVAENKIKIHSPNLGRKFYYAFSDKPPILTGAKLIAEVEPGRLFLIELTQPTAEVEN